MRAQNAGTVAYRASLEQCAVSSESIHAHGTVCCVNPGCGEPIKPMGGICLKCYAAKVAELKAEIAALREHIYSGPHSLDIIL